MDPQLKARIIKWNRDRCLLGNFDPALERKMLTEEANEFYMAESLAHMMAEYCDFVFVSEGTRAKYFSQKVPSAGVFSIMTEGWGDLTSWINDAGSEMEELLQDAFESAGHVNFDQAMDFAMSVVITNNELKGTKKHNGKIVKAEGQIDPAITIQEYLND